MTRSGNGAARRVPVPSGMADAPSPAPESPDRIYTGLRGAMLAAGTAYALLGVDGGDHRLVLAALSVFVAYSAVLHALARRHPSRRALLYAVTGALDLGLIASIMAATGGAESPFGRALYVWVSTLAFVFGRRAGLGASLSALAVSGAFQATSGASVARWPLAAQAVGMLLHGPLIGLLTDRERARTRALRSAHEQLAALNRRVVGEQSHLIQTEKLSSLGLLAAGVAHEINNPLAGVTSCVKTLRAGALDDARREEYFETVLEGLERIRATVRGLLDYARQTPPSPATIDVAEMASACARLVQPAARAKDVTIDIRARPGEVTVVADRSQVMQAVVNVLMNALYAAPAGDRVTVSAPRDGERAGIRIADGGPGIPGDLLDRVCDPFFTTKAEGEGTGLGLAVTLGVVRANGGELAIASEAGRGTEVTLWLPTQERAVVRA